MAKAHCRKSGLEVTLKLLVNQCGSEYECVKVLREIQLMKKLNKLGSPIKGPSNSSDCFAANLIEIICPKDNENKLTTSTHSESQLSDLSEELDDEDQSPRHNKTGFDLN